MLQTPEDFERHFDDLMAISARSWKAEGGTDIPSTPQVDFYRSFTVELEVKKGCVLLICYILTKIQLHLSIICDTGKRLAGIRADYDTDFRYYMPGTTRYTCK